MSDPSSPSERSPTRSGAGAAGGESSLRSAIARSVHLRDLLALAVVPAALAAVFALPTVTKERLWFDYTAPDLLSAYAANFVHFVPVHLAANLVGYALLAGMTYLLAALAGRRRLFWTATVTNLTVFPVALSYLNLTAPRQAVSYGFSGVNMAFLGLLGVVIPLFVRARLDDRVSVRHAPLSFLAVVAVSTPLLLGRTVQTGGLVAAAVLGVVLYARTLPLDGEFRRRVAGSMGWSDLLLVAAVLLFAYPFVGFPDPQVEPASIDQINLLVHFLGFALAFLVAYVAVEVDAATGPSLLVDGRRRE